MKAIVQSEYGAPQDVFALEEIEMPVVGEHDVRVRVKAAGVHIGDALVSSGLPYLIRLGYGLTKPKGNVPGMEFAGVVDVAGDGVTDFEPGDEVVGWASSGAFAEYVSVGHENLVLKPAAVTFEDAAVMPISGFTALQAVRDIGGVESGQMVLVVGASGGVGLLAVQIAKSFGAEVTGVCSTRNVEMVQAAGADHVIDYTDEDFTAGDERYDVIIDTVCNHSLGDVRNALSPKGTYVIVGGSGGRWLMGSDRSLRALALSPFVSQKMRPFMSKTTAEDLEVLMDLVDSEKVSPEIDRTFALNDVPDALDHVAARHTQGKTVITF